MKPITAMLCLAFVWLLTACSTEEPESHVWEDQTKSIDQAREVGATLDQAAATARQAITDQGD